MEYVGELCERERAEQRVSETPATDIFLMELGVQPDACAIDALHVRNASAFANFGCRNVYCNMEKRACVSHHWDTRVPHAAFFATRDICPGETLTYRRDEAVTSAAKAISGHVTGDRRRRDAAPIRCRCGQKECLGWV